MKKAAFFLIPVIIFFIQISCKSTGKDKSEHIQSIATIDSCAINFPKAQGYVNDFNGLFSAGQKAVLDSIIAENEKRTGNQIAIVTIDSATLGKCDIMDFATALGNKWGVGQKEKDNGILIAICTALHKIAISNGYGIEKTLSNADSKYIIDNIIVPEYKKGNYFEGTQNGLLTIIKRTEKK